MWSAGVLASPAGRWLDAATDTSGKVIVNSDLSIPGHPEVFAIGDTAHLVAPSRNLLGMKAKKPMLMPGVAQPVIQEGRYVARLIRRRTLGRKPQPPFWCWDKGDLAIVGRACAVADLRFLRFAGFPAGIVWALVHIYFLIGFANRFFVMAQWSFVNPRCAASNPCRIDDAVEMQTIKNGAPRSQLRAPSWTLRRKERPFCVMASLLSFGDVRALCKCE